MNKRLLVITLLILGLGVALTIYHGYQSRLAEEKQDAAQSLASESTNKLNP